MAEWKCNGCQKTDTELNGGIQERYSLDIYAGRYCDLCWDVAPYRKEGREGFDPYRKEGREGFDPSYAGESYEEDY